MTITSSVGVDRVPGALSGLSRIDYADRFTLTTDVVATPERWARAMIGDVPSAGEWAIWRGILGLRLAHGRSPETVGGWRVTDRGPDRIRLETASWFLAACLLVQPTAGEVSLATFLRYDGPTGHVVWPGLSYVHRLLVPGLLTAAEARIGRIPPG